MSEQPQIVADNVLRIEVVLKKSKAGAVGRFFSGLLGVLLFLIGCLLCITIVGILPGIGMILSGAGLMALAVGKQIVECPACKKRVKVPQRSEDFRCPRCEKAVIIDWRD